MAQTITEQIPSTDWEATPSSVKNALLSLERERDAIQERLEQLEQARKATSEGHDLRLKRYQLLVEQQIRSGLTPEQQREIERLGAEIDAVNSAFDLSLSTLAETIANSNEGRNGTVAPQNGIGRNHFYLTATREEFNDALNEIARMNKNLPVLNESAFDRENLYEDRF